MTTTSNNSAAEMRAVRDRVLERERAIENLAAPGVKFRSHGRVLIIGPEHRVLVAAQRMREQIPVCGLITQAMPPSPCEEMEAAAQIEAPIEPYRLPLKSVKGFLGQFQVDVMVDGAGQNLAKLAANSSYFDTILDLGTQPALALERLPAGYFHVAPDSPIDEAVNTLTEMVGEFEKPRYFVQDTDLCAHSRNGLSGCTRCLDVCPADAISSADGQIRIDTHLCHGAGGCTASCPTGAIRYGYPQTATTLDLLQRRISGYRQLGGSLPVVVFHDAFDGQQVMDALAELPGNLIPVQVEELGAAGQDAWLSALAWGASRVVLAAGAQVADTMVRVLKGEIQLIQALLQGAGSGEDRLQWLDLRQVDWQARLQCACDAESLQSQPVENLTIATDKREQVTQALDLIWRQSANAAPQVALETGAPFGDLVVDAERCTLCMACVASCPQKALTDGQGQPALHFTEATCVQCGLCTQACPESAISLNPRYLFDIEQRLLKRELKRESPYHCIRCDKPFSTEGMVLRMLDKLAGHSMFQGTALERLKMCEDCRVIDIVQHEPGHDLYRYARGAEQPGGVQQFPAGEEN